MKANVTFSTKDVENTAAVISAGNQVIGRVIHDSKSAIEDLLQSLQDLLTGKVDQIVIRKETDEDSH